MDGSITLDVMGGGGQSHTEGLSSSEVEQRRTTYGFNEIKDRSKKWPELLWNQVYGDHWYPNNIPAMMWVAIIVSLAIEDWIDAGVVLALHSFNSLLGFYETLKAGDAVAALKSALAPQSNVCRDGQWIKIPARELVPGDLTLLKIGDVVPADGTLLEGGTMDLDQSGLTGESLPVKKSPGDTCYSGTVVKRGEQHMVVTAIGEMTEMGKGVALIQSVDSKGQVEVIMNRITLFLLVFALVLNVILIIVEVNSNAVTQVCTHDSKYNGCEKSKARKILSNLVVLVIATIPIATPVVVTATMAIGARKMAAKNAVVTRLSAIEELAGMTVLCSDKTGTLTKNVLTIDEPHLIGSPSFDDMMFKASLAAKAVDPDAIDKCCRESVKDQDALNAYTELEFLPFDPVIKRTEATVRSPEGKEFKVTKGAPQVILDMVYNTDEISAEVDNAVIEFAERGLRPVAVAQTDDSGRWVFLGLMSLFDPPRDDTKDTIERALALGSSVKMVTGDHLLIAKETCRRLGMGTQILTTEALETPHQRLLEMVETVDGFAEVFPEHKFDIVALYQENGHITGMTGDGVNDAPALRKANVGFAVEGATPAAQGAASVILLTPGLSVIITAIRRSRKIFQRLQNYLIYRVFLSVFLLTFFFAAIIWARLNFPSAIIIVMCVVFDLATMSLAYDKVVPSPLPNKWNLTKIITIATTVGIVGVAGGLVFLAFMRDDVLGLAEYQRGMKTPCSYGEYFDSGAGCTDSLYLGTGQVAGTTGVKGGWCQDFASQDDFATHPDIYKMFVWGPCPTEEQLNNKALYGTPTDPADRWTKLRAYYNKFGNHVPDDYTVKEDSIYKPEMFPYSQATENTAVFLVVSLIAQFGVFITRVDTWFWTRRPGYVLLAIMFGEMILTTIVVAAMRDFQFWSPMVKDPGTYIRLTKLNGRYIGIGWVYAIVIGLIMELAKIGAYKAWDLFDYRAIEKKQRLKVMEESRRRMTLVDNRRRQTMAGMQRGMSVSESVRKRVDTDKRSGTINKRSNTATKGDALTQPLLGDDSP
eukprot:m.476726 g.476726  ORF g.476726 m.476726 type:complete len:1040 (+) comp20629_c0_seq1:402-3521(+)